LSICNVKANYLFEFCFVLIFPLKLSQGDGLVNSPCNSNQEYLHAWMPLNYLWNLVTCMHKWFLKLFQIS